ncbi:MAG: RNA polymerase sigma factor [Candidatus Acidiferrales bacterium]
MTKNQKEMERSDPATQPNSELSAAFAEESSLVEQAKAGDQAAFASLVRPYMRKTYHVALRITGNKEDAEDASQQSVLKAYSHIDQFNSESRFSTWLTRIAINEALMKVRKRRSEDSYMSYDFSPGDGSSAIEMLSASDALHPETLYSKKERQRVLREAIGELRGSSRVIVWLLGLQERQTKEAAQILNLSESAVKARFLRARNQLRECLAERI